MSTYYAGIFSTETATIASGASLSGSIDLTGRILVAVQMPSAWTAASITFQASNDGTTFDNVYDTAGTELAATVAASRYVVFDPADLASVRWIKLRSGTSGTPVNQAAERTLTLVARPV